MALDSNKPNIFQRLGHFFTKSFYGKNMKKHQKAIDGLHKEESKSKWDDFADRAKDKDFVKAVKNDPRSDDKLKLHTERLHQHQTSKQVAVMSGDRGKTYAITRLPNGDFGCSCGDWRYKGSVNPGYRCKHIREYIRRKK